MTILRNKDGELWDPVSGFVYDDDGKVLRPGLPGHTAASPGTVKNAAKGAEA